MEKYKSQKAHARVHVGEEHTECMKDLIKQLGKNRGNKDVQVKRVQTTSTYCAYFELVSQAGHPHRHAVQSAHKFSL